MIAEPTKDRRGRRQYVSSRENGMHALRHYYASITLADGVNIKELAEYLGHSDPGFTLRLYTHTEQAVVRSPTTSWEPDDGLQSNNPQISL